MQSNRSEVQNKEISRNENIFAMSNNKEEADRLIIKKKRLQVLERQAAYFGSNCPAHIIMEIEDLRQEIDTLSKQ